MSDTCPSCRMSPLRPAVAHDEGVIITHRECSRCGFSTRQEPPADLGGIHILIVEDTADSRELLRIILETCGAVVRSAGSAEEAQHLLAMERPELIVSDIAMPDDGIELIRVVKAEADAQPSKPIPVIAITAHRGRREELLAEGFAYLVEKPIDPISFCGVIRRHAQVTSSPMERSEQPRK